MGKDADAPPSAKKLIKATLKKGPLDVTAVRATVVRQLVAQGKSEKKASSRSKHPWEASPPPKRVPDPGKRVPPKRAPPPPRRPTGFTFEGPRRRDPPKRPPPPLPEPSPRPVSSPKTLYEVLGASQYASAGELRKRYRALSLAHHPDRGGDTTAMMKINSAWDVLGDAATRRRYDASLPD